MCFRANLLRAAAWCSTAVLCCTVACGGGSNPIQPSPSPSPSDNFSGTWQGTVSSSVTVGTLNVSFTLTQTGLSISGTFTCSFGTASCLDSTGTVTGTVTGTTVSARVLFRNGQLCDSFNGALSGETITGTYSCTNTDRGTWAVRRATTTVCTYTVSPTTFSFAANEGTGSATVVAPAGCSWSAATNANWITITAGSSGSGNGQVSFRVADSIASASRVGTLTVAQQAVTITQAGAATNCQYGLTSPKTVNVSSSGGTGFVTFQLTAGTGCTWTAAVPSEFSSWLSIQNSSGNGNIAVGYTVAPASTTSARNGQIQVRWSGPQVGENIIIQQQGR